MRKKLSYEKPSLEVLKLEQQPQLLTGSTGTGSLSNYNWNTPDEE